MTRKVLGPVFGRLVAFHIVGVLGVLVQLGVLASLVFAGVHYLAATVMAVEAAVVHNFVWHEHWTWRDRRVGSGAPGRLIRFNLSVGSVSIAQNLILMRLLAGYFGIDVVLANLTAVLAASALNFVLSNWLVFEHRGDRTEGMSCVF